MTGAMADKDRKTDIDTLIPLADRARGGNREHTLRDVVAVLARGVHDIALRNRAADLFDMVGRTDIADLLRVAEAGLDRDGLLQRAEVERLAGRLVEADALLVFAAERFGDDPTVRLAAARLADQRFDHPASLARWQALAALLPGEVAPQLGMAVSLRHMGRRAEADAVFTALRQRAPDDLDVLVAAAQHANATLNWRIGFGLWEALRAKAPEHPALLTGYGEARWQWQLEQAASTQAFTPAPVAVAAPAPVATPEPEQVPPAPEPAPVEITPVAGSTTRLPEIEPQANKAAHELVVQFESLGATSEFALVQRRVGAEPLGLLRWSEIGTEALTTLIETRFADLASVEGTQLEQAPWGDWMLRCAPSGLVIHNLATGGETDRAALLERHRGRLAYRRDALLATLAEGRKMFVHVLDATATLEDTRRIAQAFAAVSPGWLMLVVKAGPTTPAGSVHKIRERLLLGHLSRINPIRPGAEPVWNIAFDEWQEICAAALELRDADATSQTGDAA
jgi:hypothetical protein